MKTEERDGPTPNGGVKSKAFYKDDDDKAVDKDVATQVEIVEYDRDGTEISRTYGAISH